MTPPPSRLGANLSPRNLRLIEVIAREGSLLRAAQGLNMTQSAVTKALQDLESGLACTLFERTNRGVVATPYGQALVQHARVILTQISHAEQELADLRDGAAGVVTVGTLLAASTRLLPGAIARVRVARPGLAIRTIEGTNADLMPRLRQGALDLVVGRLPVYRERDGIAQEPLITDRAAIVARVGHPLLAHPNPGLTDLAGCDWILPPPETTLRRQIDESFRAAGLQAPGAAVETLSVLAARALILSSDLLAVWPEDLVRLDVGAGQITTLPVRLDRTEHPIGLSTRIETRLSPAALVMIDALRAEAAQFADGMVSPLR